MSKRKRRRRKNGKRNINLSKFFPLAAAILNLVRAVVELIRDMLKQ